MKISVFALCFLFSILTSAQKSDYSITKIADSLKENANAVIRLNKIDITIVSQRNMNIKTQRIVTVLNEKGLNDTDAYQHYDKTTSIKNIEAIIYDALGNEIKRIKRKDFKDQSAVSGSTLFSDSRLLYLEYTPVFYPFTIVYNCELETSTTANIPSWYPLRGYFVSVEKNILNVTYPINLGFRKKEFQFSNFNIQKTIDTETQLSYTASYLLAQKPEDYSPPFFQLYPKLMMGLEYFNLEGVDGNAKNWQEYGKWFSEKILSGTTALPEETKIKIKALVGDEKDPIKKARIIYKFVQDKSRYVSVQVGIGGFKPMLAQDVDRLGYGDCKALSNYTRALLNAVDVPSYYTELYGDKSKIDIQEDFFSIQGNHAMLCVPNGNKYIFLECTSQSNPFGYQANFTDDRNVVVMKPDGGEVLRTKNYESNENTQNSKGLYTINENGELSGKITIVSEGSQYEQKERVSKFMPEERDKYYKKYWSNINNLKLEKISYSDDKEKISLVENVQLNAVGYGNITLNKMMFTLDVYNQNNETVRRIRNRKNPFQIEHGYHDTDEIEITLPTGFLIEFLPTNFELKGKFGEYKTEIIKRENNKLTYKRSMFLNKGKYSNKEYDEYRVFMEQVSRNDKAKIILTKN